MGRPSKLTPAVLQTITDRLSKGEPMAVICRDEGMPATRTVRDWINNDPDVSAAIARAREDGEDAMAAECLLIADNSPLTELGSQISHIVETIGDEADEAVARKIEAIEALERRFNDLVQERKLRIETRLKLLAKWNPRKWGDGLTVRGDKDNPVQTETRYTMTDAELQAIAARARGDAAE